MEKIRFKYKVRNDLEWFKSEEFNSYINLYNQLIKIEGLKVNGYLYDRNLMLFLKGEYDQLKNGIDVIFRSEIIPERVHAPIGNFGSTKIAFRLLNEALEKSSMQIGQHSLNTILSKVLYILTIGLYTPEFEIKSNGKS